ncbi:hypothetical protein HLB23_38995 [Nocardia uniformis]|uniref:Uncharacterized protein n=1 Tax=Nocardia uniformis TaxID=53432 RepID=A0A849CAX7_9NOCA|nr:hypothetical protein [Nocardia uniformis]NNH75774.1 hypothetical protein [Nocardia uniformis]
MRHDAIRRKFKLHEDQRRASELPQLLLGLEVHGFVRADELPQQLLDTLADFATGATAPHQRIYAGTAKTRVDEWHSELLRRAGIGERFFLQTGLEYFPWADCRITDERWLDSVRGVLGQSLGFIAHDRNSAVVTVPVGHDVLGYLTVPLRAPADNANEATVLMARIDPSAPRESEVAGG